MSLLDMPYPTKLIIAAIAWFFGLFIGPVLLAFTPFTAKRLRWLDGIYGNRVDGTGYDYPLANAFFRGETTANPAITMSGFTGWVGRWFPRYAWLFLRNPVNNLLRAFGPNGTVESVRRYGRFLIVARIGGRRWWHFHWRYTFGRRAWGAFDFGYRLWRDDRTGSLLVPGHHFENALIFRWQPLRFSS